MQEAKALELCLEYDAAVRDSERWSDVIERSKRGSDYYVGLQTFNEATKARLTSEGKPWLIFNEVLPIINNLTSVERGNRKDSKVVEHRGGYSCVAELLTELLKHVMDMCDGDYVKSEVFLNGVKSCLGWFKLEIDYEREPVTGQVILRSRPSLAVRFDPACLSYDLNDPKNGAQFVIDTDWVHRSKLKAQYPDKSKDIDQAVEDYIGSQGRGGVIKRLVDYLVGNTIDNIDDSEVIFDSDIMQRWRCLVQETWFKEYEPQTLVCDKRTWEIWWLDPKKKADRLKIAKAELLANHWPKVFEIKEKFPRPILHKLKRIGQLVLKFKEDPYNGVSLFPLIPFSPFGEAQYDMGMVDNLVGPQDELNKRMTNAVHILNQTANGGMVIGKEVGPGYKDILRDFGSSPNMIIELDKCGGHFEKITPNQLSQGHMQLQATDKNYIEEISGVTGSSRGYEPNRQESGRLYREKVKQSMATNQVIYDRFDYSVRIMGYTMMEMIRHTGTYTPEEISLLIDDKDLVNGELLEQARIQVMQTNPPPQNPLNNPVFLLMSPDNQQLFYQQYEQMLQQYTQQADAQAIEIAKQKLFEQLKAYRTGKYGVVVIQSPNAPTTQISNFYELDAIKELIPAEIIAPYLIRATSLPKDQKEEMVAKLEQLTNMADQQVPA